MNKIRLHLVGSKLNRIKSQGNKPAQALAANPLFREALCFLQHLSERPDGLEHFAVSFFEKSKKWVSTLPPRSSWQRIDANRDNAFSEIVEYDIKTGQWESEPWDDTIGPIEFASWLPDWCEITGERRDDWFFYRFDLRFPGILKELTNYIEDFARDKLGTWEMTPPFQKAFKALDNCWKSRAAGPLILAASPCNLAAVACQAFCCARPGRARLVRVPPYSSWDKHFFGAYGEAFGMDRSRKTESESFIGKVTSAIRFTRILPIHDFSGLMIRPGPFDKLIAKRLDWLRSIIVNSDLPCAFLVSPDDLNYAITLFTNGSRYNVVSEPL